MIMVQREK